jgi:hypothetical protein
LFVIGVVILIRASILSEGALKSGVDEIGVEIVEVTAKEAAY